MAPNNTAPRTTHAEPKSFGTLPKQGEVVESRDTFAIKSGGKIITINAGDRFWRTNASTNQTIVVLAREGKGSIGQGWPFDHIDFVEHFRRIV